MTAQSGFEAIVRGPVAETLHRHGFKGTSRMFWRVSDPYKGIISSSRSPVTAPRRKSPIGST